MKKINILLVLIFLTGPVAFSQKASVPAHMMQNKETRDQVMKAIAADSTMCKEMLATMMKSKTGMMMMQEHGMMGPDLTDSSMMKNKMTGMKKKMADCKSMMEMDSSEEMADKPHH